MPVRDGRAGPVGRERSGFNRTEATGSGKPPPFPLLVEEGETIRVHGEMTSRKTASGSGKTGSARRTTGGGRTRSATASGGASKKSSGGASKSTPESAPASPAKTAPETAPETAPKAAAGAAAAGGGASAGGAGTAGASGAAQPEENPPRAESPPPPLRRKELVSRVAAASGLKPGVIRPVLEGVLAEMGRALAAGEGLNLPPLGKLVVKRSKEVGDSQIMICRLRRKIPGKSPATPLEPPAKEG